ncbi:MAG: YfbK domain-containing protein [Pirellulales bacterium]
MPESRFDDWIDQQLRNVPLPPNLLERLSQAGPNRGAEDARLDAALCEVAVPVDLETKLLSIARPSTLILTRRRSAWQRYATAASLFLVIGLGAAGFFGLVTGALGPGEPQVAQSTPPTPQPLAALPVPDQRDASPLVTDRSDRLANRTQPAVSAMDDSIAARPVAAATQSPSTPLAPATPPTDGPRADILPVTLPEQPAFGSNGSLADSPDLEVFQSAPIHGVSPPLVQGYDLLFQLKHGEHPFVSPALHQSLAETKFPFSFRTASYDQALAGLRSGQVPPPGEIRIEDFLAAEDYDLPVAPPDGLALHVAAAASPLETTAATRAAMHGGTLHLLSLALQGASHDTHRHRPSRLIVAIDSSASMNANARMATVRRALSKLAQHMDSSDRVTLVRSADTTSILAASASRDELATLLESDLLSATSGTSNLSRAIEAAGNIARDPQATDPRRVIVITDSRGNYDAAELPKAAEQLGALAKLNVPWRLVRLNSDEQDAHWAKLAEQAGGRVAAAQSPDDVYQEMVEAMTGWPAKVAKDVTITLSFNPQAVAAYRLIGHEATTLTGLSPDPVSIDLGVDQLATGVYEVALKPESVETVGSIEVVWQHPASGKPSRIVRPILKAQLAGSFFEAPSWFQETAIVAKSAEALRGSTYLPTTRPAAGILDVASRVDASLAQQPDFQVLLDLLKKSEKPR